MGQSGFWFRLFGGEQVTAEEFKALKSKIKEEMNRRCLAGLDERETPVDFGSLRKFASTEFDFTEIPIKGEKILTEHGEKTINLLYEIKDLDNLEYVAENKVLPTKEKIETLDDYLSAISLESIEGENSSCRGACSGLCFGSCINGCNGCSGACNSGCQGCTATCGTGCAGSTMA